MDIVKKSLRNQITISLFKIARQFNKTYSERDHEFSRQLFATKSFSVFLDEQKLADILKFHSERHVIKSQTS